MPPTENDNSGDAPKTKDAPKENTTQTVSQQALDPKDPTAATVGRNQGPTDRVPGAAVSDDGSITFQAKNDKATYDGSGRVTEVQLPNNQKRAFTYDKDGQLNSFTEPDGKKYELKDGKWVGPDGKPAGIEVASVSGQGDLVFTSSDRRINTHYADGHNESINLKDNSIVTTDTNNRVTSVHYANGQTRQFAYDQNGNVNKVTEPDGKVYENKDGKWVGPEGNSYRADVRVLNDGTYSYKDGEGNVVSRTPENKVTVIGKDGSATVVDGNGRPSEISYPNGEKQKYEYDNDGRVNKITRGDGSALTLQNGKWVGPDGKDTGISDVTITDNVLRYKAGNDWHFLGTDGKEQVVSVDQMRKAAESIHDAKDHKWGGVSVFGAGFDDPERDKIWNIIEPMSAAQRQVLAEEYEKKYNHKLTDDLRDKLGGTDGARVEALLHRKDGVADNAGTIHEALAKLNGKGQPPYPGFVDDDRVRAEKEIRDAINTLTADQLREVAAKYKKDYGRDLEQDLMNNPDLSASSKEALKIYMKGNDKRTDDDTLKLADMALKDHRPDLFNEAFRDASQAARDKFKANDGYKRIEQAFYDSNDVQISKDYLERGTVSIATIVRGDTHWYHTNKDDITRAMERATEQDRKDFKRGEELAKAGITPGNAEDQRALDFYRNVDKALEKAGNDRERALWEAKLRNDQTVIKDILSSRDDGGWFGWGAHTDKNKLFGAVENMSKQDWEYLKTHPEELRKIDDALRTFDDSHRDEVMSMLLKKLGVDSYDQARTVGNRGLEERLQDSKDSPGARADALATMSPDERQRYLENKDGFRDKINGQLKTEQERYVADSIARNQTAELTPVQKVLLDGIKNDNPVRTFNDIEDAFKKDPTLRDRINNPKTEEDKKLSQWFHRAADSAVDKAGLGMETVPSMGEGPPAVIPGQYDKYNKIFETGTLPLDLKVQLTNDQATRNEIVLKASPEEKARLLQENPDEATKRFQDMVLGRDKDKREVLLYALKQKDGLSQADQFRQFALGQGGNQDDLRERLQKMTPEQRQDLANEYFTKYHKLITEDVIGKVGDSDRWRFRELLGPTDVNVRQIALDAQHENNKHTSAWDNFLRENWDYTRVAADSTQDNLTKFIAQHSAELEKLTPEQRKQFDDAISNYMQAQKNYINSKGEFAQAFVDATITVAAIGGSLFTGGTSLALLGAIGAGGALYRVAMMKAINGTDFDGSMQNVLRQGFEGGAAAMLMFLGPEQLGLKAGLKVGDTVAVSTAEHLVTGATTKTMFREGSEAILKQELAGLTREAALAGGEKEIMALAERVAADGADKNLVAQMIRDQLRRDTMAGLKNFVLNETEALAKNMVAALAGAEGKEVVATAVGFESPETLWERMKGNAVATAAGVTFFHGLIRTATTGGSYLRYNLGRDAQGNFFAGEGTIIRKPDGTLQAVGKEPVKMQPGDTVYESGSYTPKPDGTSELKVGDRTTTYDNAGKPVRQVDGNGNSTEYHYDVNPQTNQPELTHLIAKTPDGSLDVGRSFYRNPNGEYVSYADNRVLGTKVELTPDGSIVISGRSDAPQALIGERRYSGDSNTELESYKVTPDGRRTFRYKDGVEFSRDVNYRLTEMVSETGERFKYGYDGGGRLTNVEMGSKKYSWSDKDNVWLDQDGKPFAKEIRVDNDYGVVTIKPTENFRAAGHPFKEVSEIIEYPGGMSQVTFKESSKAPTDANKNPPRTSEREQFEKRVEKGEVTKQGDGTFVQTDSSGARTIYDADGQVKSVVRANGEEVRVTRDGNGVNQLETVRNGRVESTVTKQADGTWVEKNANGEVTQTYREVKVDPDGSVTKLRKSQDYSDWTGIKERPDGLKVEVDYVGREKISGDELGRERARVKEYAEKAFPDKAQRERFEQWMQDFEKRAGQRKPPLSQEEIANTYYQIDKMLSTPNSYMDFPMRAQLAELAMYKAANPHTIGQGPFNTCNVTAEIENRLMTSSPSALMDMMAQVATTGRYIDGTGNVIDMSQMKNTLAAFKDTNNKFNPESYGGRDAFDRIVQSTSINVYWQAQGPRPTSTVWDLRAGKPFQAGDLRYELTNQWGASSSGEVINNYGTNPPTRQVAGDWVTRVDPVTGKQKSVIEMKPADSPNLTMGQLLDVGQRITGRLEEPHMLSRAEERPGVLRVNTAEDLQVKLKEMQEAGNFPATVYVDTRDPIFGGGGKDGGVGGAHVINVQRVFEKDGKWYAEYTNQWSSKQDRLGEKRAVPIEDLYRAMGVRAPETQMAKVWEVTKQVVGPTAAAGAAYAMWKIMVENGWNPFADQPPEDDPNGGK